MRNAWVMRQYGVADAAVVMAVAFACSAILGIVRQTMLGATFGDGAEAAAYYAAARLPETFITFVAGGAFTAALVPLLLAEREPTAQQQLMNVVLTIVGVAVAVLSLIGIVMTEWFVVTILLPGIDAETQRLTINVSRLLFVQPLLLAVVSVLSSALTAHKRFSLIAIAYVMHNPTIIAGIWVAQRWPEVGIYGPALGLVLAAIAKLVFVWIGVRGLDWRIAWDWQPHLPQLRRVLWLALPTALSVTVNYAGSIVDTSFAAQVGVTTVAAIYSGWLLADMPARLIGSAIGQAVFPHLAQAIAQQDINAARRLFVRTLATAVALAIPVVIAMWLIGRWGITLVLERGAFDAAAGDRTFAVLQWYIVGLPAYIMTELLSRMLNAMQNTHTPLLTNIVQLSSKWALLRWFGSGWGLVAVPIAHMVTCYCETMVLAFIVWRRVR
ncbi:MAG: lipid II flippase MurJ [Chloroflexota bacterium]